MDGLRAKKKLYAGLGDYSRQLRMKQMGEKYGKHSTGNEALDAVAASQDEAIEGAGLPKGKVNGKGFSMADAMGDVAKDAEGWQAENEKALADFSEDEEMEKWTRKQMGK